MGLDMYLSAEQRITDPAKDAPIVLALSEEHRKNLKDEDWGHNAYVSGWDLGQMRPDPAYAELIRLTGMKPEPQSPHFNVELDTETGDLRIRACCAYWRKANHIHAWFVDYCQGGVDECQLSDPIHPELLADLIDRCKQVLETPLLAAKLLPTQLGFFFGGVEYDEYYISDTKYTIDRLTEVVETYPKPLVLRYQSSW